MIIGKVGLLVCGTRTIGGWNSKSKSYEDDDAYNLVCTSITSMLESIVKCERKKHPKFTQDDIVILSGVAKGPDEIAMLYSVEKNVSLMTFHANWERYGRGAGFVRNSAMIERSEYVLACYDGISTGTKDTMYKARKNKLKIKTIIFE